MRRVALFLAVSLILIGCSRQRMTYRLDFNVSNDTIQEELIRSSLRIIEREAARLKTRLTDKEITTGSGTATIMVAMRDTTAMEEITARLTTPFTLRFMLEAPKGTGDVEMEEYGSFRDANIGEKALFWAEAAEDPSTGMGKVRLLFTPEGLKTMQTFIRNNRKKQIGLFVQGRLVSKLLADQVTDTIIIRDIPTGDMARSFADLVNVGLHVTFLPAS